MFSLNLAYLQSDPTDMPDLSRRVLNICSSPSSPFPFPLLLLLSIDLTRLSIKPFCKSVFMYCGTVKSEVAIWKYIISALVATRACQWFVGYTNFPSALFCLDKPYYEGLATSPISKALLT